MKINKESQFVQPIITESDDLINPDFIDSKLIVEFNLVEMDGGHQVGYTYLIKTNNPSIDKLLSEKKAQAAFNIRSLRTFESIVVDAKYNEKGNYALKQQSVFEYVSFLPIIYITENINDVEFQGLNEDYNMSDFKLKKGDLIGIGEKRTYLIGSDKTQLEGIVKIKKHQKNKEKRDFIIDVTGKYIKVFINEEEFEKVYLLEKDRVLGQTAITMSIHIPALITALYEVKKKDFIGADNTWYEVCKAILSKNGVDLDNEDDLESLEPFEQVQYMYKLGEKHIYEDLDKFLGEGD